MIKVDLDEASVSDGWTDGQTDGWTDGQTYGCMDNAISRVAFMTENTR